MNWIQRFASYQIYQRKKKRATAYIIDETVVEIAKKHFWLWICIEPKHSSDLRIHISNERNMLVLNILSDVW
jgi:transposase-like protein